MAELGTILVAQKNGLYVTYTSATTIAISAGSAVIGGVVYTFSDGSATFADIDIGSEAAGTTYYVYVLAAGGYKISVSASAPTGYTTNNSKLIGWFYNNLSSNIEQYSVASGTNTSYPERGYEPGKGMTPITHDGFSRADGVPGITEGVDAAGNSAVCRRWQYSTEKWTIASGKLVGAPVAGVTVLDNGDMENGTTSWVALNATLSSEASIKHGGAASLKLLATAANGYATNSFFQGPQVAANTWYRVSAWVYSDGSHKMMLRVKKQSSPYTTFVWLESTAAAWTHLIGAFCPASTSYLDVFLHAVTDGTTIYVDDVTVCPLTLAEMMASVQTGTADNATSVDLTIGLGAPGGVVVNLNSVAVPTDFVMGYIYFCPDEDQCRLVKCVNGVYTQLLGVAVVYVPGATVQVVKNGTTYQLFYNGAQVGTDQTISDATIISNTLHGVFTTDASTMLANFHSSRYL